MNRKTYEVIVGGEKYNPPPKGIGAFIQTCRLSWKTFSRDLLIEDIWGYDFEGNKKTLNVTSIVYR